MESVEYVRLEVPADRGSTKGIADMQADHSPGRWLSLGWRSRHAVHRDCVAVGPEFETDKALAGISGSVESPRQVPNSGFTGRDRDGNAVLPRAGRFYPPSFLPGLRLGRPFRVLAIHGESLRIDASPPLAGRQVEAVTLPRSSGVVLRCPGPSARPVEVLTRAGVGFQAAMAAGDTDFGLGGRFERADESADTDFYATPRMIHHLDAASRAVLAERQAQLLGELPSGAPVLDLMSSWHSHLAGADRFALTGLGLNAEELAANPSLATRAIHDLNREPGLPFVDRQFAGALCSLSVEYLVEPLTVFGEMARVLQPGAPFVVAWTERWFPPKAIALWAELHPYERVGMVVDCFRIAGGWTDIVTESWRGLARPADDRYADRLPEADPLYLVHARRIA